MEAIFQYLGNLYDSENDPNKVAVAEALRLGATVKYINTATVGGFGVNVVTTVVLSYNEQIAMKLRNVLQKIEEDM